MKNNNIHYFNGPAKISHIKNNCEQRRNRDKGLDWPPVIFPFLSCTDSITSNTTVISHILKLKVSRNSYKPVFTTPF